MKRCYICSSALFKILCFHYLYLQNGISSRQLGIGKQNPNHIPIFYDLNSILDVFHSEQFRYSTVCQPTLKTFQDECLNEHHKPPFEGKRRPFIVIEGNHGTSNAIVFRRLCKKMGAVCMKKTAKCLDPLKKMFPVNSPLRRAFFGLSMYAQAYSIKQIVRRWPVVMNGYWTDQTSFAISRTYANRKLPTEESPIYKWPNDLLAPDIIFYLNFPEELQLHHPFATPKTKQWKTKVWDIYRRFQNLPIVEIRTSIGWENILSEIQNHMMYMLSETCHVNFKNMTFASYERK